MANVMVFLDQHFICEQASPEELDRLWAQGWRHFGTYFFRYSVALHWGGIHTVIPLRVDLARFVPSRSQKRILAKNRDLTVKVRDSFIDGEKTELFLRHRRRFKNNIPDSIYDFLTEQPANKPCLNREVSIYEGKKMVAASFLDVGERSTSAVYSMFDPVETKRSLGIFAILQSIQYSIELNYSYYYIGYAYREPSIYDYKKNFGALESFDWKQSWRPMKGTMNEKSQLGYS
jgi:arginine-tRNA-protein transferase